MVLVPIVLGLLVLSMGFRAGLYYPVIVNFGLLLIFYSSLSAPKNFIQRIAETIEKQPLDSVSVKYTSSVTKIWCVFFFTECSDIGDSCVAPTTRYMGAL